MGFTKNETKTILYEVFRHQFDALICKLDEVKDAVAAPTIQPLAQDNTISIPDNISELTIEVGPNTQVNVVNREE